MAQQTAVKTSFTVAYAGGGAYTCSSLKHSSTDEQIELAARAVNGLQSKAADKIFKVVSSEISA